MGLVLSVGATGLIAGYQEVRSRDLGFDGRPVTTFSVDLPEGAELLG